jgi:Asp-tRNA(Asn)/Glu-tRNA(Gln) amidotransferase A subunit family amidase
MAEEVAGAPGATLHVGPIAANLCDLNYAYHILSCFAPQRPIASRPDWNASVPLSLPLSLRAAKSSLAGVRVGIFTPWLEDAHEDLVQACRVTLKALEDEHGAVAKEVVVPGLEHCRVGHAVSIIRDMRAACARAGVFDAGPGGEKKFQLGLDARAKLAVAADFTDDDERRSEVVRARAMTAVVDGVFSAVDILLTPTLGAPPPPVPRNLDTGELNVAADSAAMRFALLGNVTGVPAVTVPVGEPDAATGFRASVQLMGAPWCEDLLMRVAACCT